MLCREIGIYIDAGINALQMKEVSIKTCKPYCDVTFSHFSGNNWRICWRNVSSFSPNYLHMHEIISHAIICGEYTSRVKRRARYRRESEREMYIF